MSKWEQQQIKQIKDSFKEFDNKELSFSFSHKDLICKMIEQHESNIKEFEYAISCYDSYEKTNILAKLEIKLYKEEITKSKFLIKKLSEIKKIL